MALLCSMWDLSSPTRDQTCASCTGNRVLITELPGDVLPSPFRLIDLLFIFGCTGSLLLSVGFSLAAESRGYSLVMAQVSHCSGFSCCRAWALGCVGFSSYVTWAYLPRGMWDLPGPGTKPMSPSLAGRFLTTGPQGKSLNPCFNWLIWCLTNDQTAKTSFIR